MDLFLKILNKIKYLKMMRLNFFKMIVKNKLICKIMVKIKKSNHIFKVNLFLKNFKTKKYLNLICLKF